MKLWQHALVPTAEYYSHRVYSDPQPKNFYESFALEALPTHKNMAKPHEVLLLTPASFVAARSQVMFLRNAGLIPQEQALSELEGVSVAAAQVALCRKHIKKLQNLWNAAESLALENSANDPAAIAAQKAMLEKLESFGAIWLLPCFVAWGDHRAVDPLFFTSKMPVIVERCAIDESNEFLFRANLDHGSFNLRMCAIVAMLADKNKIDPRSAAGLLEHAKQFGPEQTDWHLMPNGQAKSFPDAEQWGPRAFAALESIVLKQAINKTTARSPAIALRVDARSSRL